MVLVQTQDIDHSEENWGLRFDQQSVRSQKLIIDLDLLRGGRYVSMLSKYKITEDQVPQDNQTLHLSRHIFLEKESLYSFKDHGDSWSILL